MKSVKVGTLIRKSEDLSHIFATNPALRTKNGVVYTAVFSGMFCIAPFIRDLPICLGSYSRMQVQEEESEYIKKPQQTKPNQKRYREIRREIWAEQSLDTAQ